MALALIVPLTAVAMAADPGAGTVGPGDPTEAWTGHVYAAAVTPDPAACPNAATDPDDLICDHYALTVDVAPAYWDTHDGGVDVSISWADGADDFDLYVYDPAGVLLASSAQGGTTSETAVLSAPSGAYEVRVLPFLVTESGYDGEARFHSSTGGGEAPPGGPAEYRGTVFDDGVIGLPDEEPENVAIDPSLPPLVLKFKQAGRDAAEPTIAVDAQGRAFYAAASFDGPGGLADTKLLRSKSDGRRWKDVTAEPVPGEDLPVTLDPYVYIEEDSGRVFDLDLYVASAYLSYSDDAGQTWETNPLASGPNPVNDHQTLFAGPAPEDSLFQPTDPDFPELVYYCFNRVADSSCSRSTDGGATFVESGTIAYPGVEPMEGGAFCGGLHGHVAVSDQGMVGLPKGHCGRPYMSVSTDAGLTWTRGRVSDRVDMPDNQAAVAYDESGNVYYVWFDSKYRLPWLSVSTGDGLPGTWTDPMMIAPPGVHEVQWPTIAASEDGRIAVTFPGTTEPDQGDLTRAWDYYVVTSIDALSADPTFVSNIANPANDPVHRGDCPGRCGNMLDFLDVVISPAADVAIWATVVDTCTRLDKCRKKDDAVGFNEDDSTDGVSRDMKGMFVRQIGGPRLG